MKSADDETELKKYQSTDFSVEADFEPLPCFDKHGRELEHGQGFCYVDKLSLLKILTPVISDIENKKSSLNLTSCGERSLHDTKEKRDGVETAAPLDEGWTKLTFDAEFSGANITTQEIDRRLSPSVFIESTSQKISYTAIKAARRKRRRKSSELGRKHHDSKLSRTTQ